MFQKMDQATTVQEIVQRNTGLSLEEFLFPEENPFLYQLTEAVACFKAHKDEPVTIVGDYDCDGICATAILYWGLKYFGVNAKTRLPHRFSEGYGLSTKIIDEIDSGLIITVDNGIAALDAIKKAKEKGLTVIVTDHHLAVTENGQRIFPCADVVLDPNAEDESEYKNYCGAGLAYRFVKELLKDSSKDLSSLEVLASIATVADVMKLTCANRILVKNGLKTIEGGNIRLAGLKSILERINVTGIINEDDYGFKLGPIFNASGRLYDNGSELVLRVLTAEEDEPRLNWWVDELISANEKRKQEVTTDMQIAEKMVKEERPIVIYHPNFGEGIIGIIAGNLCEKYHCPVIVFTKTEQGFLKGSGRSIPSIHLKNVLDRISGTMLGYGGHEGAAGLSIPSGTLDTFRTAFQKACGPIPAAPDVCMYDLEVTRKGLQQTLEDLKLFAPYGEGNPKPLFHLWYNGNGEYKRIGDGSHFMLKGNSITLLGFGLAERFEMAELPNNFDCIGYLKEDWYKGKCYYKFEIVNFEKRCC